MFVEQFFSDVATADALSFELPSHLALGVVDAKRHGLVVLHSVAGFEVFGKPFSHNDNRSWRLN